MPSFKLRIKLIWDLIIGQESQGGNRDAPKYQFCSFLTLVWRFPPLPHFEQRFKKTARLLEWDIPYNEDEDGQENL